jgi:hypothetical protein
VSPHSMWRLVAGRSGALPEVANKNLIHSTVTQRCIIIGMLMANGCIIHTTQKPEHFSFAELSTSLRGRNETKPVHNTPGLG